MYYKCLFGHRYSIDCKYTVENYYKDPVGVMIVSRCDKCGELKVTKICTKMSEEKV